MGGGWPREDAAQAGPGIGGLLAVMDRLRSPGGCAWDAEQTHSSLARYLLEETYEVLEALDTRDRTLLREELGDLLLQVVFHSRIAAEDRDAPFTFDEVAGEVAEKLVRRHPHVFDDEPVAEQGLHAAWEQRKRAEKRRRGVLDGIPEAIPALLLATKVQDRLAAARREPPEPARPDGPDAPGHSRDDRAAVGAELFAAVTRAREAGVDPEQALREYVRGVTAAVARSEAAVTAAAAAADVAGTTR